MGMKSNVLKLEEISHQQILKLDRKNTVVIATMSPLEVHGPHLPIGMDYMQAYRLAVEAAGIIASKRAGWSFLMLPPVPVAKDTVPALGSIDFPVGVVRDVAFHLLAPFAKQGFGRLALASFHGGPRHLCALEDAAVRLRKEFGVPAISIMSAALSRLLEGDTLMEGVKSVPGCAMTADLMKSDRHAGFIETSMALHLWPDLVEEGWQSLPGSVPVSAAWEGGSFIYDHGDNAGLGGVIKRVADTAGSMAGAVRHFRESTYCGYPALSSPEAGKALFEQLSGICAGLLEELIDRGMEMDGHSPLWRFRDILLNPAISGIADRLL